LHGGWQGLTRGAVRRPFEEVIGDDCAAVHPLTGERAAWLAFLRHIPWWLWLNPPRAEVPAPK